MNELLTISEIQALFRRSRTWIWNKRKEGLIKPSSIDSRRFLRSDIERLLRSE